MNAEKADVGARGVDSLPLSQSVTLEQAVALKASGIDFFVGYLGVLNRSRLGNILAAGIAFMPVTLAGSSFDGPLAVAQCSALGLPPGCTVWVDLEGKAVFDMNPLELIGRVNAWADTIRAAGFMPGLYVGSPQPLTSEELWALRVVRYWNALSRESDRRGALAEPKGGWCMWQMNPSIEWRDTEAFVDVNMIGQDFLGRVPSWVR